MKFVVTAGPTREYLDPVRFLSNPSSGLTGFAVAAAAAKRGETVLIAGPGVALPTPDGVRRVDVVSARDMCRAVLEELESADGPATLVMTAAVADWRPAECAAVKMKKSPDVQEATLRLVRNPDILMTVSERFAGRKNLVCVGFAAETGDPAEEALRKCRQKRLDMVVGNNVSAPGCGFGTDTNQVVFAYPDGRIDRTEMMSKTALAEAILDRTFLISQDLQNLDESTESAHSVDSSRFCKSCEIRKFRTPNLVLASGSPRRSKILREAGVDFEVLKTDAPEVVFEDAPVKTVTENAAAKWRAAKTALGDAARGRKILAADTIVWMDGRIFGKPRDFDEAREFLRILSGKTHIVFTGVACGEGDAPELMCECSNVRFKNLAEADIEHYVQAVKPLDRAGAYDIDDGGGWIVEKFTGSYENIMGLPLSALNLL